MRVLDGELRKGSEALDEAKNNLVWAKSMKEQCLAESLTMTAAACEMYEESLRKRIHPLGGNVSD